MSIPMSMPESARQRPALLTALGALGALAAASVLVRASPLRVTLALARALKWATRRAASTGQARRVIDARDWATRCVPGRAACMERSLAAFLMCCATGAAVDWCLGCRFDPCEGHAWIETDGTAVGEPESPDRPLYVTVRV
ncbi:lasso peptide biosynthesis B2 protein [Streptomyces boncukensis]|uniref:Lasso peptide biosynthesis B2 protein n=1 Tax=Streptomyces boncukensis TaxID=2711219 RepID=A0A6G4WZH3_9ACTN|nr:lasso peptide biosynthesis B2 protein [Streptomyces boncukensis]NGO70007.1 lasso peptide biosynthesis B2 protein [Streptomyces boncukensis]